MHGQISPIHGVPRYGQAGKRRDAGLVPEEHSMQRIVITAILAASFAGAALAESPLAVPVEPFVSLKTRSQVQTELAEYQKPGINPWSTSYNPLKYFRSTKTRPEVTAEYLASRDAVH